MAERVKAEYGRSMTGWTSGSQQKEAATLARVGMLVEERRGPRHGLGWMESSGRTEAGRQCSRWQHQSCSWQLKEEASLQGCGRQRAAPLVEGAWLGLPGMRELRGGPRSDRGRRAGRGRQ
jgi:hypothetical protein